MSTLSTTRNYDDGEVLVRADLDAFLDDIETFLNVTKINDDNIQNSGITGSTKLLNGSVTAGKLATDSVSTIKIQDLAVTTGKINDDAVTNAKIADDAVHTAQIQDDAVTTGKILDAAVTTDKIATDGVETINIKDLNVTTGKINDSAVTTIKINDGAVTPAKHNTNYVTASFSGTSATYQTGTFTTYGRPVMLLIYSGSVAFSNNLAYSWTLKRNDGGSDTTLATILEADFSASSIQTGGSYVFNEVRVISADTLGITPFPGLAGPIVYVDASPAAGTYSYKITVANNSTCTLSSVKVIAYEL